jgi:hypothetical protein
MKSREVRATIYGRDIAVTEKHVTLCATQAAPTLKRAQHLKSIKVNASETETHNASIPGIYIYTRRTHTYTRAHTHASDTTDSCASHIPGPPLSHPQTRVTHSSAQRVQPTGLAHPARAMRARTCQTNGHSIGEGGSDSSLRFNQAVHKQFYYT